MAGINHVFLIYKSDFRYYQIEKNEIIYGLAKFLSTLFTQRITIIITNIILVTTSGDGGWLPGKGGRDFDAISSASRLTSVEGIVMNVMGKIKRRLDDLG